MKFNLWKGKNEGKELAHGEAASSSVPEWRDAASSTCQRLWLVICMLVKEVLPRHDSFLCVNEHCELAILILPELFVTKARAKIVYGQPRADCALLQRINSGKDDSVLSPVVYTMITESKKTKLGNSYNSGNIEEEVRSVIYRSFVSEVEFDSLNYLNQPSFWQPVKRAKFVDNDNIVNPDSLYPATSRFKSKLPLFVYTSPDGELELDEERLKRELAMPALLYERFAADVYKMYEGTPTAQSWQEHKEWMLQAVAKVEIELNLNSEVLRQFKELAMNPEKSEVSLEPSIEMRLTPEGLKALQDSKKSSTKSYFSIANWGEPNIVQIILCIGEPGNLGSAQTMLSPAVTVFRDELGVHTLTTHLFLVTHGITNVVSGFGEVPKELAWANIDELAASEIPDVQWQFLSETVPESWWQSDAAARKILWLVVHYLCTHQVKIRPEVICSVTPIGDSAIQVAISEGEREAGTPYAFAVMADEAEFNAIPVFPSGSVDYQPDGSMAFKKGLYLKNYIITRKLERKQPGNLMRLIDRPIYPIIVSGRAKELRIYEER